ncbi:MAG: hypothetical protein Q9208_004846 [Pyrenodesmia sp. 3 TL-2023]
MLSSISGGCFAAALLVASSLASPPAISIAFGNIAYTGITFGRPFSINWFGGDGTPATIRLLTGNAASMQTAATLATGLTASPYVWTPAASQSVRPGQSYALSIEQSRLTNYSPMFTIGSPAADYHQLRLPLREPVRIGTGHYYPLEDRAVDDGKALNSDAGIFPRSHGLIARTEGSFHQDGATATPTGTVASLAHATGTLMGSLVHATGTSTGSIESLQEAARASPSPIGYANAGHTLSLGPMVARFVMLGSLLALLWV